MPNPCAWAKAVLNPLDILKSHPCSRSEWWGLSYSGKPEG